MAAALNMLVEHLQWFLDCCTLKFEIRDQYQSDKIAATYILYVNLTLVLKNSKWRYGNHGDHGPNYNVKKLFSYCC